MHLQMKINRTVGRGEEVRIEVFFYWCYRLRLPEISLISVSYTIYEFISGSFDSMTFRKKI